MRLITNRNDEKISISVKRDNCNYLVEIHNPDTAVDREIDIYETNCADLTEKNLIFSSYKGPRISPVGEFEKTVKDSEMVIKVPYLDYGKQCEAMINIDHNVYGKPCVNIMDADNFTSVFYGGDRKIERTDPLWAILAKYVAMEVVTSFDLIKTNILDHGVCVKKLANMVWAESPAQAAIVKRASDGCADALESIKERLEVAYK